MLADAYPKGVTVAEGPTTVEQHWALTSERRRQDDDARVAWAHRCELVDRSKRAERAVAELEAQVLARVQELADQKVSFVFAGTSEAPEMPPSPAKPKLPAHPPEGKSGGAAAERFNVTPRGSGGVIVDKAASKVDRMRPPEVQVRVRVGEAITAEEEEALLSATGSQRRGGTRRSGSGSGGRPRSATLSMGGTAGRGGSPMGSLLRTAAPETLDGPEPAVWQGNNTDALELGAGVAMRVGSELRRGPSIPKDPTRLTRRDYLISRTLDHDTITARTPMGASHTTGHAPHSAAAGGSDEEQEDSSAAPRERHWMDDARARTEPTEAEVEEQRQLQEWQSRGRGKHYAFEAKILEAKAQAAWGDNSGGGAPGRRAPAPVLPKKNSRHALLSQAATLSSQGSNAVQRSLRRQVQPPREGSGRLDGFAVRTGEGAARRTRLELASQALQQHVKSNVMTYRARVAPNSGSPTRAGTTRMSGLAIGGGGGGRHRAAAAAAAASSSSGAAAAAAAAAAAVGSSSVSTPTARPVRVRA